MLKSHEDTMSSPVETKAPSMLCPPVDSNTTGWVTMITIALLSTGGYSILQVVVSTGDDTVSS